MFDGIRGLALRLCTGGQQNHESASLSRLRVHLDGAPMSVNDTEGRRQSETATEELGGVERIEDPGDGSFIHPAAGVPHLNHYVPADSKLMPGKYAAEIRFIDLLQPGGDMHGPVLPAHRLGPVDDEVHHELLQLRGIGLYAGKPLPQI